MAERVIVKNFNNFRGKDSRSSDLVRDSNFAIDFQNARVVKEDSCVNREGFKIRTPKGQYNGLYSYKWTDTSTGLVESEIISISDSLYRKKENTFTIAYTGSGAVVGVSIRLDAATATFKCTIREDGVDLLSYDLGTGLESSPITLANLKTQIDALADFSATISGTTSVPAAFLPITINADLASSPKTQALVVYEWEKMSTLSASVFSAYNAARGNEAFELASCVNMMNCLYIATGNEYLHKYDGQNVYRAGLPEASTVPTLSLSGTGITDTNIKYMYLYKQVDNRGNTILGVESDPSSTVSPANQSVLVTLTNILAASGFNTGGAIVNGNQLNVTTITVDSGHTLKVGDTAYFFSGEQGTYVEREITATTATTITVAGDIVDVADNRIISNNLRIVIYRTTNGGNLYYKVAEIPNDSFASTQVYTDTLATASLGTQYIAPTKLRDPLSIQPKYLCVHQDLLIAAGCKSNANTWYYSNGEFPEYFDAEVNFEQVKSTEGGGVRGLGSDQEHLIVGTENSLLVITGDLDSGNARQENLSRGHTGFACHNSIVEIEGKIIFLGKTGFWAIENGFNLYEIGAPINPDIAKKGLPTSQQLMLRRAVAIHSETTQEYICFIPAESGSGTSKFVNSASRTFVLDTFHQSWGDWNGVNMGGGLIELDDKVYFQSKEEDASVTVTGYLWEQSKLSKVDDYADHHLPIAFKLGTQWLDAGEPSVFKVFLRLKAYNLLRQFLAARFTLNVKVERDFQKDSTWFSFPLNFGQGSSAGWGYFSWGTAQWGTPKKQSQKKKLRTGKAQSIRFVMENSELHQKVAISAWETEVTAPYSTAIKD